MSDDEFANQLQQEAEERERNERLKAEKVKVDPDGTVYEWDEDKKAWFPKVEFASLFINYIYIFR